MENKQKLDIQFDFLINGSTQEPLLFSNPIQLISTRNPNDVVTCLHQIDQAVEDGFYAAGYISYEAFQTTDAPVNDMPLLVFGIYQTPTATMKEPVPRSFHIGKWSTLESKETYEKNVTAIMEAIKKKQLQEINYTVPFETSFTGNSFSYYQQLRNAQASNYCAYLSFDEFDILSASPELFFQLDEDKVKIKPMKGTIHRGLTYEKDKEQETWLRNSEQNQYENRLTVELMKKELEQITIPGSLHTDYLYQVEKYPTVYQMTSEITGAVAQGYSVMDIMAALFPCSSIAGVPKEEALKLIQEIESKPREVYCGAIGYITPEKQAVFNVPIRTVWIDRNKETAHYAAGGAITNQSTVEEEYTEIQTKANILTWEKPVFDLLETILLSDGSYDLYEQHMKRLQQSADYFDIPVNMEGIQTKLEQTRKNHYTGNWRVRLTSDQKGSFEVTVSSLKPTDGIQPVRFAAEPIDPSNCYLYHKTTHRTFFDFYKKENHDVFDVLMWNWENELTEFTIGNLVIEWDHFLYTPPISSGLLPGTFRAQLINAGNVKEKRLFKQDLLKCHKIWLINSVRKWVEVKLV